MYNHAQEWQRVMQEEERRLMNEVSNQRMSWDKLGNIVKLNAIQHANRREWQNFR